MRTKVSLALIAGIFLWLAGTAHAQQVGIGGYERLQIVAHDVENQARLIRFRAERQYPRYRSDREALIRLQRLQSLAANFHDQVEQNFDDPRAVRSAYQRLLYSVQDADFALRRSYRYGYLAYDFRQLTRNVSVIQRLMSGFYNRDDDRRYNDDDYYDYDHHDDYDYDEDDYR